MDELTQRPITELAPLIARAELSPTELVTATLERIRELEPQLCSYVTVFAEDAMASARTGDDEISSGRYRGPLHGIPVAVKDSIAVAGWPTTNGSALMADHVTDVDAAVVTRLREAGAIVVGKSNMHEWGIGGTCTGMHFGTVRNPHDLSRVPGGSSGGSATAVSAGLATAAIAADGWGSIRTPASYCGVVGLKPSYGLVSRFGETPSTSSPQHQIGPITRSAADAAIVMHVIAGYDPRDPTSLRRPVPSGLTAIPDRLDGVRVGVARSYFYDDAVAPVVDAVEAAAGRFASLGAEVTEVEIPALARLPLALASAVYESQSLLLPLALNHPEGFATKLLRYTILATDFVREADARRARQLRNLIRAEVQEAFTKVDLVLGPCNSTTAFPIDAEAVEVRGGHLAPLHGPGAQGRITTRLTLPWNLAGVPAISFPSGRHDGDGLPIALQLAGSHWNDAAVLAAAGCYETAFGGYRAPALTNSLPPQ